jgi:hypothetical protein
MAFDHYFPGRILLDRAEEASCAASLGKRGWTYASGQT